MNNDLGGRSYFHVESAPRKGHVFELIVVVGLCAAWTFGSPLSPLAAVFLMLFGLLLDCGLRDATGGYGSWLADGTLHWQYPNRFWFYRRRDYCRIADVAEFQILVPPFGDAGGPDLTCRLLLKNGDKKSINPSCFGYFTEGLIRALQKENPTIVVARVERERSGWTHSTSLDPEPPP